MAVSRRSELFSKYLEILRVFGIDSKEEKEFYRQYKSFEDLGPMMSKIKIASTK